MTTLARAAQWIGMIAVVGGLTAAACNNPASDPEGGSVHPTTGLTGTILRGPIMPVCQVNVPCDGPMAAQFSVKQNSRTVATFQTDSAGRFTIALRPGTYVIVPNADPLMNQQSAPVTVQAHGLTSVQLRFDTGIR